MACSGFGILNIEKEHILLLWVLTSYMFDFAYTTLFFLIDGSGFDDSLGFKFFIKYYKITNNIRYMKNESYAFKCVNTFAYFISWVWKWVLNESRFQSTTTQA